MHWINRDAYKLVEESTWMLIVKSKLRLSRINAARLSALDKKVRRKISAPKFRGESS